MTRLLSLTLALACLTSLTAQTPPASPSLSSAYWFTETGASSSNSLLGGLGVAVPVGGNQEIFGELALQTGSGVGQSSTLLFGVKSNYPMITVKGRKLTPFSIVGYGASIQNILKQKFSVPSNLGLTPSAVNAIGTSAGLAQQYAAGFETPIGSWNLGIGMSGDKVVSGWKGYPFVFVSRNFGGAKP